MPDADFSIDRGSSVALGFFDGVHTGHQAVIRAAVQDARANGRAAAVFTFRLPLSSTMKGGRLLTERQKHQIMEQLGVSYYMEPAFEAFCEYSPEAFVTEILHGLYHAKAVFCGENFTFGKKAAGNIEKLKELCQPLGIQVVIVPMTTYKGELVSSTRIRAALNAGDIASVNDMLGRPYAIDFPVQHGQGLGHVLGFPTINQIYPEGFSEPKYGIYITRICINDTWYIGATGFGNRPTVNDGQQGATCETFILDFEGQLYGEQLQLEFYQYIAPTRKFENLQQLQDCISNAAQQARQYFSKNSK